MANGSYLQMSQWVNNNASLSESCNINDSLSESCNNNGCFSESCNNSCQRLLEGNSSDKYTAAIELSNKCREFYQFRLQTASSMKSRWCSSSLRQHDQITCSNASSSSSLSSDVDNTTSGSRQQRHRIDEAMDKLRLEMVSLMDQDLSLMKQLLTLNETIEDLKWQQQFYTYSTSWASSSASKYLDSNLSVSDTRMYDSEDDLMAVQHTSYSSVQGGQPGKANWYGRRNVRKNAVDFGKTPVDSSASHLTDPAIASTCSRTSIQTTYTEDSRSGSQASEIVSIHHERGENSFDSGIHESISGDELTWSA